jgi:PIN domain nuclease of toxin-antitoxin system
VYAVILLDTHVLIWLAQGSNRISRRASEVIREARESGGLAISSLTLFEVAQLVTRGRVQVAPTLESFLAEIGKIFVIKHIDTNIALISARLPDSYPRDPVDRLIGATAIVERMPLVTADERIRESGCLETVW